MPQDNKREGESNRRRARKDRRERNVDVSHLGFPEKRKSILDRRQNQNERRRK